MTRFKHITFPLAFAASITIAGPVLAQQGAPKPAIDEGVQAVVEGAIEKGNAKLKDEIDRVPGLKYDDISRISGKIPGKVQIPDPTSTDYATRAVSVPGGLVSEQCKHFARGFLAKRLMTQDAGLTEDAALAKVTDHLYEQRLIYAKLAGTEGLKRSDAAIHEAKCPVCGPLNAAEIECHKAAVKKSPIRELVMFDFASDVLRGGYYPKIQEIKALLDEDSELQVALVGRASIPGGPIPNFELSGKRITSVWNGMTKAGIPVDRIVAIPIGEDEPHIDLQLAIEYDLADEFGKLGQQPLNQSVYMVVFRPGSEMMADVDAGKMADGDETKVAKVDDAKSSVVQGDSTAAITFTLTDGDGSLLLPGVKVTATNAETSESRWIITNDEGKGFLRHLVQGNWLITFERDGYATENRELRLGKGEWETANVALATAGIEDQASSPEGDAGESKSKKLLRYFSGEIGLEALKN